MREAKQRWLAAKGWKTGDAKGFLGLSEQEEVYIDLHLKLAEGLKTRRIQQRLTQFQLAEIVQSSQSRIAEMESGDPTVSLDALVKALLALGTSARELAKIIASP